MQNTGNSTQKKITKKAPKREPFQVYIIHRSLFTVQYLFPCHTEQVLNDGLLILI